ncbi:unnamed protein product, partial [Owenia fusiformis]
TIGTTPTPTDNQDEKLQRIESEKENLVLQVSVLTDQCEAATEKISELEKLAAERQERLAKQEVAIEQEVLAKTSLETHKLDLMAENSNLKIKLAASERDKSDFQKDFDVAQRQINELQGRINEREAELMDLRLRVGRNGTIANKPAEDAEVDKLKQAVESLMTANNEKDHLIEELRKNLRKYRRVEELIHGKKDSFPDEDTSDGPSPKTSVSSMEGIKASSQKQPEEVHSLPRHMQLPSATSTPVNSFSESPTRTLTNGTSFNGNGTYTGNGMMTPPSTIHVTPSQQRSPNVIRSNSCENVTPVPNNEGSPPGVRRGGPYSTLPRDVQLAVHVNSNTNGKNTNTKRGFVHFPEEEMFETIKEAETEVADFDDGQSDPGTAQLQVHPKPQQTQEIKKKKGLKKFFTKIRRSSSQDLEQEMEQNSEFKRGGVRATAGPRLGWSKDTNRGDIDIPFARWDNDKVALWVHQIGLSMYVGEVKRWCRNGEQLLRATPHDLEKHLDIKNYLHRKKLQLALQSIGSESNKDSMIGTLDHHWVTKWLDDIGLPQYKDYFTENRVDGRMLHYMTVEDLLALRVTNALHHVSIKRAIQVLRLNNFNPACLKRRPSPDESNLENKPYEVMLWTNHRVMEWLRSIDLSEYAPNMRGSGVHGALMVLEPRFSSEILGSILSIPNSKTLLRRHLHTHFVSLISNDVQQKKRECETQPGFLPLAPNSKVKAPKKRGIFSHKRSKSQSETDFDDYLCPMIHGTLNRGGPMTQPPQYQMEIRGTDMVMTLHQKQKDEKVAKEVGAFSHEMNTLTNMLAKDQFFDDVPTSNV